VFTFLLILVAPFDRFYHADFIRAWPYFNWELGFGSIPYEKVWNIIFIDEIDGKKFDPPVRLSDYIQKNKSGQMYWIPTKHYIIQSMLAQAHYSKDQARIDRINRLIQKRWLNFLARQEVKYHLATLIIDPLKYRKDKTPLRSKIIRRERYVLKY
jgi:hypothetical protein